MQAYWKTQILCDEGSTGLSNTRPIYVKELRQPDMYVI